MGQVVDPKWKYPFKVLSWFVAQTHWAEFWTDKEQGVEERKRSTTEKMCNRMFIEMKKRATKADQKSHPTKRRQRMVGFLEGNHEHEAHCNASKNQIGIPTNQGVSRHNQQHKKKKSKDGTCIKPQEKLKQRIQGTEAKPRKLKTPHHITETLFNLKNQEARKESKQS